MDVLTLGLLIAVGLACVSFAWGLGQWLKARKLGQDLSFQQRALSEKDLGLSEAQLSLRSAELKVQELRSQVVRLETELRLHHEEAAARMKLYEDAEQRLSQTFQLLSGDALRQSHESFLQLARSVLEQHEVRAQGDMELRQQAVHQLIEPIHRSLEKVQERIFDIEKQRVGAYQGLQEQIGLLLQAQKKLQLEASQLATALRSPTTRGRWGELQLRRVVELAGMIAHCDFFEQSATQAEGRQLRPDMIIRLPGNRSIAIDAKVPLQAYLEALECAEERQREALLQQYAQHVRKQVQALGQKAYWDQLPNSPEFVLLFLPGEAFFSAALQADPTLLEVGVDYKVLIATPTTLIALLRTAAYGWRQEDMTRHALEVSRLGKELYQRIADLSAHVADMGRSLGMSVQAYNKMVGTLESRVMVSARRFQELKADDPKKELRELAAIESHPRVLNALELDL